MRKKQEYHFIMLPKIYFINITEMNTQIWLLLNISKMVIYDINSVALLIKFNAYKDVRQK